VPGCQMVLMLVKRRPAVGMHAVLEITGGLDASTEQGLRGLFDGHEGPKVGQTLVG
jgi:hypothetical protein